MFVRLYARLEKKWMGEKLISFTIILIVLLANWILSNFPATVASKIQIGRLKSKKKNEKLLKNHGTLKNNIWIFWSMTDRQTYKTMYRLDEHLLLKSSLKK